MAMIQLASLAQDANVCWLRSHVAVTLATHAKYDIPVQQIAFHGAWPEWNWHPVLILLVVEVERRTGA
jgi:hypothetical protein